MPSPCPVSEASRPIAELLARYRAREVSPVEVVEGCLVQVAAVEPALHAYIRVTHELARRDAAASAQRFDAGEPGPLDGVPVAVKDVFPVAGYPTTFGSRVHQHDAPLPDSGAVRRLRAAGAVVIGKTNTAEFGQSATTENLLGPSTRNPWDPDRTAGGSSGGSAAAVGTGTATFGLGTDGGGSLRIPAAFTGLVGFKPTTGRCRDEGGLVAMSPFSSPGPLSLRTSDARVVAEVLAEEALPRRRPDSLAIGYLPAWEPIDPGVARLVGDAAAALARLGHHVEQASIDLTGWRELFGSLVVAEEWRERGALLPRHADDLTRYERLSLEAGSTLSPEQIERAESGVAAFRRRVDAALAPFTVVVTPATAVTAFPVDHRPSSVGGQPVDRLWGPFPFTAPWNVAGCPALVLPCGFLDGLPVGVQLVARAGADHLLLDVAQDLEDHLGIDNQAVLQRWVGGAEGS